MARRVEMFTAQQNPKTDKPRQLMDRKDAIQLIAERKAVRCGDNAIQVVDRVQFKSSEAIYVPTQQGAVYELSAIDPNPRTFNGGLTRTEKQPSKFSQFKGARVGHQ